MKKLKPFSFLCCALLVMGKNNGLAKDLSKNLSIPELRPACINRLVKGYGSSFKELITSRLPKINQYADSIIRKSFGSQRVLTPFPWSDKDIDPSSDFLDTMTMVSEFVDDVVSQKISMITQKKMGTQQKTSYINLILLFPHETQYVQMLEQIDAIKKYKNINTICFVSPQFPLTSKELFDVSNSFVFSRTGEFYHYYGNREIFKHSLPNFVIMGLYGMDLSNFLEHLSLALFHNKQKNRNIVVDLKNLRILHDGVNMCDKYLEEARADLTLDSILKIFPLDSLFDIFQQIQKTGQKTEIAFQTPSYSFIYSF